MQQLKAVGIRARGRSRGCSSMRACLPALLACLLAVLLSGAQLQARAQQWQTDESNLNGFFTPPEQSQQQQQGPPGMDNFSVEQWQQQQARGGQQQQQQQPAIQPAALLEQVAALLQMASRTMQPGQGQQQQQQQQPPAFPSADSFHNMYNAHSAPAPDTSLLQQQSAPLQHDDGLLPLARRGVSSYGFTVPPADVQARMRAAKPKPLSDLAVMERISRKPQPGITRGPGKQGKWFNLEKQFQKAPELKRPAHMKQKPFHLSTRSRRSYQRALLPHADSQSMQAVQSQNPFGSNTEHTRIQKSMTGHAEIVKPAAAATATADAAEFANSPAMLAFRSAEAQKHATVSPPVPHAEATPSTSPALLAFNAAATAADGAHIIHDTDVMEAQLAADLADIQSTSLLEVAARPAAVAEAEAEAEPVEHGFQSEFQAPAKAQPSKNFRKMFQSIMRSHRTRKQAV